MAAPCPGLGRSGARPRLGLLPFAVIGSAAPPVAQQVDHVGRPEPSTRAHDRRHSWKQAPAILFGEDQLLPKFILTLPRCGRHMPSCSPSPIYLLLRQERKIITGPLEPNLSHGAGAS